MKFPASILIAALLALCACDSQQPMPDYDKQAAWKFLGLETSQEAFDDRLRSLDEVVLDPPPEWGKDYNPTFPPDISFDPETFPKLWLHLAFEAKMRATVEVTTKIDYEMKDTPFRTFRFREAEQLMNIHVAEQRRLFMEMQKVPRRDQNKIRDYQNKIKKIEEPKAKLLRLFEVCKKLNEKPGKVHFRVYTVVDEQHEIPLMQSFPLEESGAAEAVPPAKKEAVPPAKKQ